MALQFAAKPACVCWTVNTYIIDKTSVSLIATNSDSKQVLPMQIVPKLALAPGCRKVTLNTKIYHRLRKLLEAASLGNNKGYDRLAYIMMSEVAIGSRYT